MTTKDDPETPTDGETPSGATSPLTPSGVGTGPVEALILLSFGGPEKPEDVMPFLENVTRGRGIPRERLSEVAEHYLHLGGRSPINALNLEIIENLRAELAERGRDLEVVFANRNWEPYVEDAVAELGSRGISRAAVFATSAWGGYSGCAQYQEDIERARNAAGDSAPELVRLGQFFSAEAFVALNAEAVSSALGDARAAGESPRLVFTAHSIPESADADSGPAGAGRLYSRQIAEAAALVAARVGAEDFDLVWQSRSGPPQIPWLEPDIVDHAAALAAAGETSLVVCPIGFISDHVEVIWDLDSELAEACEELGLTLRRAATPGPRREFASLILELLDEVETGTQVPRIGDVPSYGCRIDGKRCAEFCCGRPSPSLG